MADTKISNLTAATTPLDGTEVLPIVQSSTTKKVANNDLRPKQIQSNATSGVMQIVGPAAAATRVMTVPDANFTVARTDAAQTFTGNQTFNNSVGIGGAPSSWSLFNPLELAGNGAIMGVSGLNLFNNAYYNGSDYIYKTTAAATRLLNSGGEWYWYRAASGTAGTVIVFGTPKMTLDASDNLTLNAGNLVQGTAAKGVNFTANTPAAGMTSQLLNWYEEGTYTPTWNGGAVTVTSAYYTRIGRQVTCIIDVTLGSSASGSVSELTVPFSAVAASNWGSGGVAYSDYGATVYVSFDAGTSKINFRPAANDPTLACSSVATKRFAFTLTYFA